MMAHTEVKVQGLPYCYFCKVEGKEVHGEYDAKTRLGPWAYLCEYHFKAYGIGLGLGKGQRLVVERGDNG